MNYICELGIEPGSFCLLSTFVELNFFSLEWSSPFVGVNFRILEHKSTIVGVNF